MIEFKNISKIYKNGDNETRALDDVSFRIDEGEYVAIMGPSGSGKSTLMHILGCLDNATSGTYLMDGEDISKFSENRLADVRKKKIGFVFQAFNLLPRASVIRNVSIPLIYAGMGRIEREEKAKNALISAAFPEKFWNHHSNQLSGGMMQRVAIARALVNDPTIVLADEPTGNLDSKTGEIVLRTFERLHDEEKRTIVLITHERDVAEHAERIIFVKDGKIISDEKNPNRRFAIVEE